MPAPITATDRGVEGVEVMAHVLSRRGRDDVGRVRARRARGGSAAPQGAAGSRWCGAGPRGSAQADHSPGFAELPLDALEAELLRLRDPHEVPDHGADVDGGEDA